MIYRVYVLGFKEILSKVARCFESTFTFNNLYLRYGHSILNNNFPEYSVTWKMCVIAKKIVFFGFRIPTIQNVKLENFVLMEGSGKGDR